MKNFQQTPKQRRLVMSNNKASLSLSRKTGRTYAEAWTPKLRIGTEPITRLERFDHTRGFSFNWY